MLRSGAKMTGVPYRSGGESVTAVLAKAVHTTLEGIAIMRNLVLEGKLRALAGQNRTRTPLLAGHADHGRGRRCRTARPTRSTVWSRRPARPPGIVEKLNAAMNQGLATEEMQKTITGLGSESKPNSPEEFAAYIAAQTQDLGRSRQGRGREDRLKRRLMHRRRVARHDGAAVADLLAREPVPGRGRGRGRFAGKPRGDIARVEAVAGRGGVDRLDDLRRRR